MVGVWVTLRATGAAIAILLAGAFAGCGGAGDDQVQGQGQDHAHGAPAAAERWLCPMHPTYVSDRKGSCPICGMDLVPAREFAGGGVSGVPGMAEIELSDEGIALAGVRTVPVVREALTTAIRAVGRVTADETRVVSVQTRVGGWIEDLSVQAVGQSVRAGQPLLTIYSPELLAGQEELLRAISAGPGGSFLVEAARRRLLLFGVPQDFLDRIETSGVPSRTVPLPCPATGVVTGRAAFVGMRVEPGMELFTVTDLGTVWILADFYESEAPLLGVGLPVKVELPFDPGVVLPGTIDFVYPTLDAAARTQPVRVVLANPFGLLRPGMYADVTLEVARGGGLVIPDDAILDTGPRRIVFLSLGGGRFSPREVEVGVRSGGRAQILSGLDEGQQVVVKANFLLDSESRIRASLAAPAAPAGQSAPPPAGTTGHQGGGH